MKALLIILLSITFILISIYIHDIVLPNIKMKFTLYRISRLLKRLSRKDTINEETKKKMKEGSELALQCAKEEKIL